MGNEKPLPMIVCVFGLNSLYEQNVTIFCTSSCLLSMGFHAFSSLSSFFFLWEINNGDNIFIRRSLSGGNL